MILPSEALIPKISGKEVLIFRPYSIAVNHFAIEQAVCGQLGLMGAKVKWLICNGIFSECDRHWQLLNPNDKRDACRRCVAYGMSVRDELALEMSGLGDFLTQSDYDRVDNWLASLPPMEYATAEIDGLALGRWVKSSVNTHLRCADIFLTDPVHVAAYYSYLRSAALTAIAFNAYLARTKVDAIFMMNGRTGASRTVFEMARLRNIPVCIHEFGRSEETRMLFTNEICHSLKGLSRHWQEWKGVPLSQPEIAEVGDYMLARVKGSVDFSFNKNNKMSARDLFGDIGDRKIVSLFTSSTDEISSIEDWYCAYSQIEWIKQVLAYFKDRPEYLLLIRCHPNHESGFFGNDDQFLNSLAALDCSQYDNVRVILPSTKVNSYDLVLDSEAVLVFNSTVSLEASLLGVKAMICGGGRNQEKNLARQYTEDSLDGFSTVLEDFLRNPADPAWMLHAARWLHILTFRYIYDVPLVRREGGRVACVREAFTRLLPQWHMLSDIIRFFEEGDSFVQRSVAELSDVRNAATEIEGVTALSSALRKARGRGEFVCLDAASTGRAGYAAGILILDVLGERQAVQRTLESITSRITGDAVIVVLSSQDGSGFAVPGGAELVFVGIQSSEQAMKEISARRPVKWNTLLRAGDYFEAVGPLN